MTNNTNEAESPGHRREVSDIIKNNQARQMVSKLDGWLVGSRRRNGCTLVTKGVNWVRRQTEEVLIYFSLERAFGNSLRENFDFGIPYLCIQNIHLDVDEEFSFLFQSVTLAIYKNNVKNTDSIEKDIR